MYVIKNNTTDKYIAIDHSSGGYPYDVNVASAKVFYLLEDAVEYKSMFYKNDWTIHELIIETKPILN